LLIGTDAPTAARVLAEPLAQFSALVAAEPSSRVFTSRLAYAWQLEARLRFAAGRADARAAVERALELGALLIKENRADDVVLAEYAQAAVLAGRIARAQDRAADARSHWESAITTLAPRLATSRDWRVLDPAAQAYQLLDNAAAARPLVDRLRSSGYQPVDPLAVPLLGPAVSPVSPNRNE
jgi:tetratricopeptide (TPR) repeat protein